MRRFLIKLLLGSVAFGTSAAAAQAQDEGIVIDIETITCREMLRMSGSERDFTIVFMHGFVSGKQAELSFDGPALTAATDAVLDLCIDEPDRGLLSVFEAVRSD